MILKLGGYWTNLMSKVMMCKFLLGWKENLRKGSDFIKSKTRERIVELDENMMTELFALLWNWWWKEV